MKRKYSKEELSLILTKNEMKIRAWFPIIWFGFPLINLLFSFLISNPTSHFALSYLAAHKHLTTFFAIETVSLLYITFHCSFRKYGNRLLTTHIALSCLSLGCIPFLSHISKELQSNVPFEMGCNIETALFLVTTWFSIQLILINKKIQLTQYLASERYQANIQSLRSSKTIEELDNRYRSLNDNLPNNCSNALFVEYFTIKSQLKNIQKQ